MGVLPLVCAYLCKCVTIISQSVQHNVEQTAEAAAKERVIRTGLKLVPFLSYHLKYRTMDKHRQEKSSEERDELASGSGEYENTSGLREKSVEEDIVPGEPELEVGEKIEKLKEDSDLDRVR